MRGRLLSSIGIVISQRNYSESDRIIDLFTKYEGKVTAIVKGVRKIKSRRARSVEIFNCIKFTASDKNGIFYLNEAEVVISNSKLRTSLKKIMVAYYFVEAINKITFPNERNEKLFELLGDYLKKLITSKNLKKTRNDYVVDLLTLLGYIPSGSSVDNEDDLLERTIEKKINTLRIGKKVFS